MEEMLKPQDNHAEVANLLSQVQSTITSAGCANSIDAERWLMSWLDTPNGALGGVEPRRLLATVDDEFTVR